MNDQRPINRNFDKSNHYRQVERFMRLAGQDVPNKPTMPSEEVRILRAKLILEEALETISKGLGVDVIIDGDFDMPMRFDELQFSCKPESNLTEIADGCCDLKVVTTGTLIACGLTDLALQEEVDQHNLKKFGPGGYRRDDGKWVKPPDLEPPRIGDLIDEQMVCWGNGNAEEPKGVIDG